MKVPVISVIVPTFNRADLLDKCLASLCEQRLDDDLYEVIVVDNISEDHTREVVAAYFGRRPQVRYLLEKTRNASIARNTGCREAAGRYLAFFDDDTIVSPEHLANALAVIHQHEPDMLGGPVYPYYTSPKPRWFKDKYETKRFTEVSGFSKTCRLTGANFMMRKEVLLQLGLFDPGYGPRGYNHVIGEERKLLELYRATTPEDRQKIYYALECMVRHYIPPSKMTLRSMLARRYRAGISMARIYHDVQGFDPGGRFLVTQILQWPVQLAQELLRQRGSRGPQEMDTVEIVMGACLRVGMIAERSRQFLRRKFPEAGNADLQSAGQRGR